MLVLTLLLSNLAHSAAKPPALARVISSEGLTSLEPQHTNLHQNDTLAEGDRITVMADSHLRLRLAGGAVVEVGPHSELLLKRTLAGEPLLRIPHGELLLVTKDSHLVEVRTAQLKVEVEAKSFYLGQQGDRPAHLCACDGKAHAKWPEGEATFSSLQANHEVLIYPDKSGFAPAKDKAPLQSNKNVESLRSLL